jgi:hypothetical protein
MFTVCHHQTPTTFYACRDEAHVARVMATRTRGWWVVVHNQIVEEFAAVQHPLCPKAFSFVNVNH